MTDLRELLAAAWSLISSADLDTLPPEWVTLARDWHEHYSACEPQLRAQDAILQARNHIALAEDLMSMEAPGWRIAQEVTLAHFHLATAQLLSHAQAVPSGGKEPVSTDEVTAVLRRLLVQGRSAQYVAETLVNTFDIRRNLV